MQGRVASVALTLAVLLAVPAVAGAATKTVQAGPPSGPVAKQFQDASGDANQFFRRTITIRKGDRVRWKINGFHTVTFVPPGEQPPPLLVPDPASPVTGVTDAAGAPFWFNGRPNERLGELAAFKQGGATFHATELHNSGLPLAQGPPPPYTLRFNQTGNHRYLCILHPGMAGTVKVVGKGRSVPSARRDRRTAQRELGTALRRVQRLTTGTGLAGLDKTIQAGNDRRSGATVFRFFPSNPSFRVGDTVTLQMPAQTSEVHTFTFGPTNGKDAYNDQLAAGLLGPVFDPRGLYPSEPPPAGVPAYTGTNHGNGFYNSGFLDRIDASPPPASTQVRFTTPGTFSLICLIHPFMTSKVTVTP
jgi:plastocyanin